MSKYTLALIDKNFKVVSEFHTDLNTLPLKDAVSYSENDILVSNCFVTEMGDMILGAEHLKNHFSDGLTYCIVLKEGGKPLVVVLIVRVNSSLYLKNLNSSHL